MDTLDKVILVTTVVSVLAVVVSHIIQASSCDGMLVNEHIGDKYTCYKHRRQL